jgi:CheY-like chemotaxis protein
MKLLVVDDNPDIVYILSSAMELYGHGVDEAHDGVDAIERLRRNSYDVVITDAEMPRMGGAEICRFLKLEYPNVYIIGMSGSSRALKELENAGADVCLSKPFSIDQMEEAVENRLDLSRPSFGSDVCCR